MIKIFLDPGHGGSDRFNRGPTGYVEADGMLDVCLKLRNELLKTGKFDVKMSRTVDATVGVRERGNIAARWGADLFISNHSNAIGGYNTSARGVNVFYSVDLPNDKKIAEKFAEEISNAMGTRNRGALTRESKNYPGEDYYGVIDASQDGGIPHVFLIENGFHDHRDDEKLLKDPNIRLKIAKAQAKVICDFYGVDYTTDDKKVVAGIVTATELNVRPTPDTNNTPIFTVKNNQLVNILNTVNGWYEIEINNFKGFVSSKYIYGLDWKQKIVKEALDLGLITSDEWLEKPDEKVPVWYICAVAINICNKLGFETPEVIEKDWKKRIIKEALKLGLLTSDEWIEKADETVSVWHNCAVNINICNKVSIATPKVYVDDWRKRIVMEALKLGLLTSGEWIEKADDDVTSWFVCAMSINILNKIRNIV